MKNFTLALGLALLIFSLSSAAIILVPADQPTIQHGINAASNGDTVMVAAGIYDLQYGAPILFFGKSLLLKSESGPDATIITRISSGSIVEYIYGEPHGAVIDGFTILANGARAIYCQNSSPFIKNCIIKNKPGGNWGSAIVCENSHSLILGNVITQNVTGGGPSTIELQGGADTLVGNLIVDNNSNAGCDPTLTTPAGIKLNGSSAVILNNTIARNNGGGIEARGVGEYPNPLIVKNNIIAFNRHNCGPLNGYGVHFWDMPTWYQSYIFEFNDVYGNYGGDLWNAIPGQGVISQDPLFCDTTYYLTNTSPCVATGEGGFNMGALGVGCIADFSVQVTAGEQKVTIIGDTTELTVGIKNIGSMPDTYDLFISDSLGWQIINAVSSINLGAGEDTTLQVLVTTNSSDQIAKVNKVVFLASSQSDSTSFDSDFSSLVAISLCGDVNLDAKRNLSDIVYLVNYIFKGGAPPCGSGGLVQLK